ncbi:hypothetical protein [Deinococcus hopiensis]|uniref:hypothetical protein n=1 Tax=Deinococcus hopiensis TaxID=309885 RepID=UPI00111BDC74|nr:hypothetical protein [Deinococcus hopiensis]
MQNAGRLRNGESIVGVNDASWTFLSYATCSIFASAVISAIYSEVRSYKTSDNIKTGLFISMLISIGITLLILWLKAGRLHLFNFIVLIFIILTRRVRWQTRLIFAILGFALGYLILTSGKSLFGVQTSNDNVTYFSKIADAASEFGFPVMSLELTTHSVNILWRFFIDYALAPIYVFGLPISAFVFGFVPELQESVAKINTVAFLGTYSSGEIPVDIVTLGYYNMGVIGVVITSLIFGFAMKSINSVFSEHNNPIVSAVKYMIIIYFISVGIMYADPVNFLRDSFYIWMPLLVIAIGSPTLKSRRNIVDVGKSR